MSLSISHLKSGFNIFIPFCTSKEHSWYSSKETTDENLSRNLSSFLINISGTKSIFILYLLSSVVFSVLISERLNPAIFFIFIGIVSLQTAIKYPSQSLSLISFIYSVSSVSGLRTKLAIKVIFNSLE